MLSKFSIFNLKIIIKKDYLTIFKLSKNIPQNQELLLTLIIHYLIIIINIEKQYFILITFYLVLFNIKTNKPSKLYQKIFFLKLLNPNKVIIIVFTHNISVILI